MNTVFVSWQAFEPQQLQTIEVSDNEVTLIYRNESELALAFDDSDQLDRFLNGLVRSLLHQDSPESVRWN